MAEHHGVSGLWRRAVKGTVIAELHGIAVADAAPDCSDDIAESVCFAIDELPWFYRRPIKMLAFFAAVVSTILVMSNLDATDTGSRTRVLAVLKYTPGFALFRKYVRALALLALFDAPGVINPAVVQAGTD